MCTEGALGACYPRAYTSINVPSLKAVKRRVFLRRRQRGGRGPTTLDSRWSYTTLFNVVLSTFRSL